jgi:hypothetical protein
VILTPVVSGANFEPIRSAASAPAVTLASSRVAFVREFQDLAPIS